MRGSEDGMKTLLAGPDGCRVASGGYLLKSREKRAGGPDGIHRTEHITNDLCLVLRDCLTRKLQGREGSRPVGVREDSTARPEPTHTGREADRTVWGC